MMNYNNNYYNNITDLYRVTFSGKATAITKDPVEIKVCNAGIQCKTTKTRLNNMWYVLVFLDVIHYRKWGA